jgi:hypothetical protein
MKKYIAAVIIIATTAAFAAPSIVITNWLPGYVFIAATNTDVGTTGCDTGTAYVCFPFASLEFLSETDATTDVRSVQFALEKWWFDQYQASASSNRPTMLTISETSVYDASTNADLRMKYTTEVKIKISGTGVSIPNEE